MRIFRIITAVLLVLWCVLIFALSAQNATESSDTSRGFTQKVISVLYPDFCELDDMKQGEIIHNVTFVVRKAAHFSIFAILGAFAFMSIVSYKRPEFAFKTVFSSLFCLLYAISDEVHQVFVAGRSGEVRDVLIDFLGSVIAIIITSIVFKKNKFLNNFIGGKNA